jgi:hypothetical protein
MINTVVQIILSVFLIAIMAFISYSIYNNEIIRSIKINSTTKLKTEIFTGVFDYTEQKNIMIETYDATSKNFLDINPSTNQNGGAEYSYNFWLFFDLGQTDGVITNEVAPAITDYKHYAYIVLFYKGEANTLPLLTNNYQCDYGLKETNTSDLHDKQYYFDENINIKNPLVKIRNDAKEIIVEYNNINFPESYNSTAQKMSCKLNIEDIKNRNLNKFGIKEINTDKLRQTFNMITIVFQEQPNNELIFNVESTNCRVYFNGTLIENRIAHSASIEKQDDFTSIKSRVMKSNLSKLLINPIKVTPGITSIGPFTSDTRTDEKNVVLSPLQVADLSYFNYALSQREIRYLYNKGYNSKKVSFTPKLTNIPKGTLYKIDKDEFVKPI